MRTSPAARISRGSGCVARFGLHIAERLRHIPGSPPDQKTAMHAKGPALSRPFRLAAPSIPRTSPRFAYLPDTALPMSAAMRAAALHPVHPPQPPEQPRGLSAWQSHIPRLHRRCTAHAAHATTISRTTTVGRLNSRPKITARLLSLNRCIFEPFIERLWMQCRFWRAGLPTSRVRALLLVKESGNLPHSGEAADKLDEGGPPRHSSDLF